MDKMREDFEKWAKKTELVLKHSMQENWYLFEETETAWLAWQAARKVHDVRCKCCGYLVTESEHRGCLRAAEVTVPDGYKLVPTTIHPLDSSNCEKVMQLLAAPPDAGRIDNPEDYYQYWWSLLLSAALEGKN